MKLIKQLYHHLIRYPTPKNLGYINSLGSLLGILFFMQILSGLFLTMYYVPSENSAFYSVEYIRRDVRGGWYLRYFHINGASFIFLLMYMHIFKGLLYNLEGTKVWLVGYIIYLLSVAVGFLGYILPWGQMSFWGATVITQLLSIIPGGLGSRVVIFVWGGFEVNQATLGRFFVLHYILPFIVLALVVLHIALLHINGVQTQSNKKHYSNNINFTTLGPYYFIKDYFSFLILSLAIVYIISYYPERFTNPSNYIPASVSKTPSHIIPEWYFLPLYSILKAIPDKVIGVFIMIITLISPIIEQFIGEDSDWDGDSGILAGSLVEFSDLTYSTNHLLYCTYLPLILFFWLQISFNYKFFTKSIKNLAIWQFWFLNVFFILLLTIIKYFKIKEFSYYWKFQQYNKLLRSSLYNKQTFSNYFTESLIGGFLADLLLSIDQGYWPITGDIDYLFF